MILKDYLNVVNETLRRLQKEKVKVGVVIGNESTDLDSVVCSLILAQYLTFKYSKNDEEKCIYLPVLSCPREDLELKTEVIFCLEKWNMAFSSFIFFDDLEASLTNRIIDVVLVDHNVINIDSLKTQSSKISMIVDHHEIENSECMPKNLIHGFVGSCSTLIAEILFEDKNFELQEDHLDLIRATILVDTKNLCPATKKTTNRDVSVLEKCETLLNNLKVPTPRKKLLKEISEAKQKIDHFTAYQLLRKDLKVLNFNTNRDKENCKTKVAMSSVPKLNGLELVDLESAFNSFDRFLSNHETIIALCSGDLLIIFHEANTEMANAVKQAFMAKNPDIQMTEKSKSVMRCYEDETKENIFVYHINRQNPAYSRKKLLPLAREAIENLMRQ